MPKLLNSRAAFTAAFNLMRRTCLRNEPFTRKGESADAKLKWTSIRQLNQVDKKRGAAIRSHQYNDSGAAIAAVLHNAGWRK